MAEARVAGSEAPGRADDPVADVATVLGAGVDPPVVGVRLARPVRARLALEPDAVSPAGTVLLGRPAVARVVAHGLTGSLPGDLNAGDLLALGLLDEVARTIIELYGRRVDPDAFERAYAAVAAAVGPAPTGATLAAHGELFPPPLPGETPPGDALRELFLTWLAASNPGLGPLGPLVDDLPLASVPDARYPAIVDALRRHFYAAPAFGPDGEDLVTFLRAPIYAAPGSLAGQLAYIRERWAPLLGPDGAGMLDRVAIGLGILAEERVAQARRWTGGGPGGAGTGALDDLGLGFVGRDALGGYAGPVIPEPDPEPERFSTDVAWMPGIVLIAKSTHVWLDQLSRIHGREIGTLDAIPDSELDRLARIGVTGLWLIGVWERSRASREIKRRRGNPEALASAYALEDYVVASDLGGEAAAASLRRRAAARGIRLASDMVPNHMGIDSRWVIEHPDWFLQLPVPPYPAYAFDGPDLSPDPRVGIFLEDHYWDGTDAAVVFKRVDHETGGERFVYHGNDGTSFPWNDTAQLDYLRADVREAVIQTILDVARQFPVIRFDAAMVLAKRHIERLWHPLPGGGGAIPSRAEYPMTKRAFDAAMPIEFWREVVDRIAAEAPGTLLLAEAFWLMEGYFVRTLGMHRVYNSAFMNLLRDEDNAGYRKVMSDTLEFDPQIIGRFVNFMSNPDEKTAVEQFGTDAKHFGVATMMATLPGLPMIGHGQLEGFRERYGMEFSKAAWNEAIDEGMLARYEREIVPLLRRRTWFAGAADFLLYDVIGDDGGVREDVYAYSNIGPAGEASLVVFHNRNAPTSGRIRESVAFSAPDEATGERVLRTRTLADGLDVWRGASDDPAIGRAFVRAREALSGLEYAWPAHDVVEGLRFELGPYDYRVYLGWTTIEDTADGRWAQLVASLGGRGVPSLDDRLRDTELAPVHDPLARLLETTETGAIRTAATKLVRGVRRATGARHGASDREVVASIVAGLAAIGAVSRSNGRPSNASGASSTTRAASAKATRAAGVSGMAGVSGAVARGPSAGRTVAPESLAVARVLADPIAAAALRARATLAPLGRLGDGDARATTRAWFAELRLGPALARVLPAGATHRTWLLLSLATPGSTTGTARARAAQVALAWLTEPDIVTELGIHESDGSRWLVAERLDEVASWASALDTLDTAAGEPVDVEASGAAMKLVRDAAAGAGYRVDGWLSQLGGRPPAPVGRAKPRPPKPDPATPRRDRAATDPPAKRSVPRASDRGG
jgi:glycosidase